MSQITLEDALEGLPVRVVDAFNLWPNLCIAHSIPLGRLDWVWNNRGNSNKESSLTSKAVFSILDPPDLTEPALSTQAYDWFRRAYVHILLVPLDELDSHKDSPAWQYIRKFVEGSREKRFEYIVAVVADEAGVRQHRKLLERLRADVNITRRERVVTLPSQAPAIDQKPIAHLYHSQPHQDLLIRLRECTRDAVEVRVQQYESELERLYPMRASPDWSFCYFFAVKESMGFVFCQLGRRDVALRLLDELHSFMVEYDEKEGTRKFCTELPCDAAANATNVKGKDYRKLFADNSITEMEMRTYLFARQTEIMLPDRKFSDIAERGLKLITAVSRRCVEEAAKNNTRTFACFRDAWVFTAARILASTLSPAIPSSVPDSNSMSSQLATPKERHTARLIAGFHVHALKSFQGLARILLPGTMSFLKEGEDTISDEDRKELLDSFNMELRDALSSPNNAEILYAEIANAAASLYEMGGRSRGAAALDGDAGVIRLRNGSLEEAEKLLSAQCSRFADDHSWDDLHQRKRKELARAEKRLDKVQEYLVSCLTMLFMTRSVRRIIIGSSQSSLRQQGDKERAEKWAQEAYETASKLPRVMKYKAEKLLTVSVRPNPENWSEGDAANAVVLVHSDVPAELQVDSLFVELKSFSTSPSDKKHPLVNQDKPETPSVTSTPMSSGLARTKTLTLKSKGEKILVCTGENEFPVFSSEVPWPGRYSVNLVALFIGNLKLVQVASKPDSYPMVSIKGAISSKEALSKVANASQQPDVGKAQVRFPTFFAKPRAVPASVHISQNSPLYLVQGPIQTVTVTVKSEIHGIAKGAKLSIELSFVSGPADDEKDAPKLDKDNSIIEVMDVWETKSKEHYGAEPNMAVPFQCKSTDEGTIEVTVNRDISEGSSISTRLSVLIPKSACSTKSKNFERECIMSAHVHGRELSSSARREFTCLTSSSISLLNPLTLEASIELSGKSSEAHAPHVLDDSMLSDGGTLYCSIRSKVEGRAITLKNAYLDLPRWLQLRKGEQDPHDDLLPCEIYECGRFIFAFDLFVCATPSSHGFGSSLSNITKSMSHIRRVRRSKDCQELFDLDESTEQESIAAQDLIANGSNPVLDPSASADLEMAVRINSSHIIENMEGITEDVEMTNDDDEMAISEQESHGPEQSSPKSPDIPEIGDVVDLSGGVNGNTDKVKNGQSPISSDEDSYATLRIEFSIEGLEGIARLERLVSVNSFRPQRYIYRIERVYPESVSAGKAVELMFSISMMKNSRLFDGEIDQTQELMYNIEAESQNWIISGRQRGRFTLSSGSCEDVRIMALPLTSGRVRIPTVQLYNNNGRPLPETCFDNLNKCVQALVLPSSHVTSVCIQTKGDAAESLLRLASVASGTHDVKARATKAHMPEVVTFETFFESSV